MVGGGVPQRLSAYACWYFRVSVRVHILMLVSDP